MTDTDDDETNALVLTDTPDNIDYAKLIAGGRLAAERYSVARLTPRYLAMSFEVWPEDRRM